MRSPPNILVLILDSMRASSMSLYGYPVRTTPALDRFARDAVVYDQAITPATWTIPAHASLLSGLHVTQHRIENMRGDRRLNRRLVSLPEALRRQGYETVAFSQNPLFSGPHGLDEGFSRFYGLDELARARVRSRAAKHLVGSGRHRLRQSGLFLDRLLAPEDALRFILRWLVGERESGRPFFAFANLLAPHFPWVVPPWALVRARALDPRYVTRIDYISLKREWEFNSGAATPTDAHLRMWRRLYDAAVMHVDAAVGRFLERAAGWSGWRDTVLVVTSDHGEMLGDHRGIVGHSLVLHDNLIRVPLLVRHPALPAARVPHVVQTHDLYRTILEWTGTPLDSVPVAQTVLPSLDDPPHDRVAIAEEDYTDSYDIPAKLAALNPSLPEDAVPRSQRAARSSTHKYVEYDNGPGEFYDLRTDPWERENLVHTAGPDQRRYMRTLQMTLLEWEAEREVFPPVELSSGANQSDEVADRLRALGYFG